MPSVLDRGPSLGSILQVDEPPPRDSDHDADAPVPVPEEVEEEEDDALPVAPVHSHSWRTAMNPPKKEWPPRALTPAEADAAREETPPFFKVWMGSRRRGILSNPPLVRRNACRCGPPAVPSLERPLDTPCCPIGGGGCVRALAEGSSGDEATACGAIVAHLVMDDTGCLPQWLFVGLTSAVVLGATTCFISVGSALIVAGSPAALDWWALTAGLQAAVALSILLFPIASSCDCEWSRLRILALCGGVCVAAPIVVCTFLVIHALASPDRMSIGVALTPMLLPLVVCAFPLSLVALTQFRASNTLELPRDPSGVKPEWNPMIRQAVARSSGATSPGTAEAPSAVTCVDMPPGSSATTPTKASSAATGRVISSGGGSSRKIQLLSPEDEIETEGDGLQPQSPAREDGNAPVYSLIDPARRSVSSADRAALEALLRAHEPRRPWYSGRRICYVHWNTLIGTAICAPSILFLVSVILLCLAGSSSVAWWVAGIGVFALLVATAASCCALSVISIRFRESLGSDWTGFYSGSRLRVHTNNARSLQLRAEGEYV
jgi:hypothetical protein